MAELCRHNKFEKTFPPRPPCSLIGFCSTSSHATVCEEPKEFRVRGRKITIVEAWLLCRKHHPTTQPTALGKRSQDIVHGSKQKGWCTVGLISERIPHLQSFWISRQEQQLVNNWEEHYWQPRKRLWSASNQKYTEFWSSNPEYQTVFPSGPPLFFKVFFFLGCACSLLFEDFL